MIRYKCTVAYSGAGYCGWQTQKNGNSVQEYIESALERIFDSPVRILAAGRTDAGVNAWGQVFQFDSEKEIGERKLMGALNGFLPKDIHIRKVEKKDRLFHVRYCVKSKQYDYRINLGEYDVFSRDFSYLLCKQGIVRTSEYQRIYIFLKKSVEISVDNAACHIIIYPALLHKRHKERTGLLVHMYLGIGLMQELLVYTAVDGSSGSDNAYLVVLRSLGCRFCSGLYHTYHRDRKLMP